MSLPLFDKSEDVSAPIEGLRYIPNWISVDEEKTLLNKIDQNSWLSDLKRRVQHYGYKYDYTARRIHADMYLGALPGWSAFLVKRLSKIDTFLLKPDQIIVNEYLPGQGISPHIDCIPCFDNTIANLSLGSQAVMIFDNPKTKEKYEIVLEPRSLVILSGPARYEWRHSIPARKTDIIDEQKIERGRRVSLTLRKVLS